MSECIFPIYLLGPRVKPCIDSLWPPFWGDLSTKHEKTLDSLSLSLSLSRRSKSISINGLAAYILLLLPTIVVCTYIYWLTTIYHCYCLPGWEPAVKNRSLVIFDTYCPSSFSSHVVFAGLAIAIASWMDICSSSSSR